MRRLVQAAFAVADEWRARGLGKKFTRWMFPKRMKRRDEKRAARRDRPADEAAGEFFNHEDRAMDINEKETVTVELPDGTKILREEPLIKARTSTKLLAVGGTMLATTAAAVIPNWDTINAAMQAACQSENGPAIGLVMMAAMLGVNYATARVVKSPIVPGKL